MNAPIATIFPDVSCSSADEITLTWSELFSKLKDAKESPSKKSGSLIKLAKFGNNRSSKNSLKHDENLIELLGIEGDYDAEVISIHEACKLLEAHGVRAILYTSWSCTHDKPRWRVLAPLSKAFAKEDHWRLLARLNGALSGVLAGESFTVAQGYFINKNPAHPYTCICTFGDPDAGEFIDKLDSLDLIALGKGGKPKTVASSKSEVQFESKDWLADMLVGVDINGNALRLVGRMVAKGYDDQTILDTFEGWQDVLIEARGEERVSDLFGGELNRMIKGARDKGYGPKTLETVLSELRSFSKEELHNRWVELVVPLSPTEKFTALQEVSHLTGVKIQPLKQELAMRENEIKQEQKASAIASRVGDRFNIYYQPENVATAADLAEAETVKRSTDFELARFAGLLVRVVVEALPLAHYADSEIPPAPTAQTEIINKAKLLPLVERAVVFQVRNDKGQISNIGVPDKILEHILVNHKAVPNISAMITHPVVTLKGRVISTNGIDRETGLLVYGNTNLTIVKAYSEMEAVDAINRIKTNFLSGFEFSSKLDEAAALALLFTSIERKLMSAAPGGLVSAAQQSTGKTTFVKMLHVVLTGRDLPVMSWPDGNETEVQKMLLSTLLRSPELICFDNVGDGLTFRSPTLALAMTSPVFEGRLLGLSRDASVPTSVMMTVTGNNIKLANDEVHRWIKVSLTTNNPSPHKRQFKHADVLQYALSIRDDVLRDCLGIIAGYRQQSKRISPSSRFPDWDALVRQPLMWAGELDVGQVFDANMEQSEEIGARSVLLWTLSQKFKDQDFGAADLVDQYHTDFDLENNHMDTIHEALKILHVKDLRNILSIGHALSKLVGVPVLAPKASPSITLTLIRCKGTSLARYQVKSQPVE